MPILDISLDDYFSTNNDKKNSQEFVKKQLKTLTVPISTVDLIISGFTEFYLYPLVEIVNAFKEYNFKSITYFCDFTNDTTNFNINIPIVRIHFYMLSMMKENTNTQKWNSDQHKLLFLTGKLSRINRIGVLKKLYNKSFLTSDKILWSAPILHSPRAPQFKNNILTVLNACDENISDEELDIFLDYCRENSILKENIAINESLIPYTEGFGEWWSHEVFSNYEDFFKITNGSILAEASVPKEAVSYGVHPATEKTYRIISQKHPFIIVSRTNTRMHLKNLGFKTFENYLPYPNYDNITNDTEWLNIVAENIIAFPKILIDEKENINKDIEHNYTLLKNIADTSRQIIRNFYLSKNENILDINREFNLDVDPDRCVQKIKIMTEINNINHDIETYNQIRGEDWPLVSCSSDFDQLPDWIKKECLEKFNFRPRSTKRMVG
jgi:hypothetical protein